MIRKDSLGATDLQTMSLLLLSVCLTACSQNTLTLKSSALGTSFELNVAQVATINGEGVRIGFSSVIEDSRCPKGAVCVWEGNAKIEVWVYKTEAETLHVHLNTTLVPKQVSYLDYKISLVELSPYPVVDSVIKPSEYVATFLVSRRKIFNDSARE